MGDPLFSDMEGAAVAVYLFLFSLIAVGGVVFFAGYRLVGTILAGGVGVLLLAVAAGLFT